MTHPMDRVTRAIDAAPHRPAAGPLSWAALVVGLVLLVFAAKDAMRARDDYRQAEAARIEATARAKQQEDGRTRREAEANTPAQLERARATRHLQQMAQFAWFDLFDLLERGANEVKGGVSVVSLVPSRAEDGVASVRITALAANQEMLFAYLRFLKDDPRAAQVQLQQQEEDATAGPQAVRFQVQLSWRGVK